MRSGLLLLLCLTAAGACLAVDPTPGVSTVASYTGPDRTGRLAAAAKNEGELLLYSSLTQEDQLRLAADFKRRYGVTVKSWRGSQANILQRVMSESRGGRFEVDVMETNAPQLEVLARAKLLQKMNSPFLEQELLPETMPAHGEWAPDRLNLLVYAYNTNAVKPADVPKSWQDLLDPKWKRRIGMESTNVEWFAALIESMGEKPGLDLFRRMGDNGVAVRTGQLVRPAAGRRAALRGRSLAACTSPQRRGPFRRLHADRGPALLHGSAPRAGEQELRHAGAAPGARAPGRQDRERAGSDRRLRKVA